MIRNLTLTYALALALAAPAGFAHAQDKADDEGVKVGKMSGLRRLVSAEQLEALSLQEYGSLKAQAVQQGALAPDQHPQLLRLRKISGNLVLHVARWNPRAPKWQWEVNLIESKQVNAFCMPGGKIAIYSGILDSLKLTDDEVAIVIGHEIAHALREHGRERAAKSTVANIGAKLAGVGLSALLGIDPNLTDAAAGGVASLTMLKFSRSDEVEADLVGLDLVARAGYDPRAGIALWQKMAMLSKGAPPQWLSTHPAGKNRMATMRQHLPEVMPLYARSKKTRVAALPPYRSNLQGITPVQ